MANTAISGFTTAAPTDNDVVPFAQSPFGAGTNRKFTLSGLVTYLKTSLGSYFSGGGSNFVSSAWYWLHDNPTSTNGQVWSAAGNIAFTPINLTNPVTLKALAIRVGTLAAGGNAAVGIYANNPATNKPTGTPLTQVSGLSTATATTVSATLGATVTLQPGIYWAAVQLDNVTATLQCPSNTTTGRSGAVIGGTLAEVSVSVSNVGVQHYITSGTYPTLPDQTSTSWSAGANGNRCGGIFGQVN